MSATNRNLTAAVEGYFSDLARIARIGRSDGTNFHTIPRLTNLLNAVGGALKPKAFCVPELADQGDGRSRFRPLRGEAGAEGQAHARARRPSGAWWR